MKKTLLTLAVAAMSLGAMAQSAEDGSVTKTFQSKYDTWIRSDDGGKKNGSTDKMELRNNKIEEEIDGVTVVTGYNYFAGLVGFDYSIPEGMKVKSATLRLVTERVKGGPILVFGYSHDFTEGDACWNVEKDYLAPFMAEDAVPAASFSVAGQYPKAMSDSGIAEDKQNIEAWTNTIDVTSYLKTVPAAAVRVNFMIRHELNKAADQTCFYTREKESLDNTAKYPDWVVATRDQLIPELTVVFVEDTETTNDALAPVADTFVRKSAANNNYGTLGSMELYWTTKEVDAATGGAVTEDTTEKMTVKDAEFYGLMSFVLPDEVKDGSCEITSASLRLTHEMVKGDRNMGIYVYPSTFDEKGAKWNTESDKCTEALTAEPIATYVANGQGNKAMWDAGITENYRTADAWTNRVDLTEYLKANPADLNILFARINAHKDAIKVCTKEAVDQVNSKDENNVFTFAADDIQPRLYITYTKKGAETPVDPDAGIDAVESDNAPVEYYNLQGVRVENPATGHLYIKRQGTRVTKVIM